MSLQSRLFFFFTIAVVVPLAIAGILSEHAVASTLASRDQDRVRTVTPGLTALLSQQLTAIQPAASAIAANPAFKSAVANSTHGDAVDLAAALQAGVLQNPQGAAKGASPLDFAVVANAQGVLIGAVTGTANYLPGIIPPTPEQLLAPSVGSPTGTNLLVSKTIVPLFSGNPPAPIGLLVAGAYLDNNFAQNLEASTGVDVTIVVQGEAIASSVGGAASATTSWKVPVTTRRLTPFHTTIGGQAAEAEVAPLVHDLPVTTVAVVTSSPPTSMSQGREIIASILIVLALAAIAAALLGFLLSRAIARPVLQLAAAADSIAEGNYDSSIQVRSGHEVGRLADAFNAMAGKLSAHIAQLSESREELKRSLTRFGETLRSTHDLDKILQVVLDTSVDALRATGGVLLVVNPEEAFAGQLTVAAARGVAADGLVLREGEGIAGAVALTGEPIRLPDADLAGPPPPLLEPESEPEGPGAAARPSTADVVLDLESPRVPTTPSVNGHTEIAARRPVGAAPGRRRLAEPSPAEPPFRTGIWVPVFAQGRIFAVLALFDREDGGFFTSRDLDTVMSLSDQAGVAIDNVVLHEEAQRLAITDGMTGIWNRRYFQLRFDQELDRSARFRRPFCLLLCDIDDFKVVNDSYGHPVGDAVLIELARRIRSEVRDIDVLARYGGEEFVLILPETDADGGQRAAEKIRRRIGDSPFARDRQIPVTISVGIGCFPRAGTDQTALLRAADVALYQAKAAGKDRVVLYQATEAEEGRPTHVG
ncbi:MAG TPA: diguanylate cyclase [Actinomycetota bacterium]|nr:diguanylate cyclase [Actinomycetota bacterium]